MSLEEAIKHLKQGDKITHSQFAATSQYYMINGLTISKVRGVDRKLYNPIETFYTIYQSIAMYRKDWSVYQH